MGGEAFPERSLHMTIDHSRHGQPHSHAKSSDFAAFDILDIGSLRPHERHRPSHAKTLAAMMKASGFVERPILVDRADGIILDGHHRFAAITEGLGFRQAPCFVVDYRNMKSVRVSAWRTNERVTKSTVIFAALYGPLLPEKTSRHSLDFELPTVVCPLSDLGEYLPKNNDQRH